jgi:hypothetical protein
MNNPILVHAQQNPETAFGDARLVKRGRLFTTQSVKSIRSIFDKSAGIALNKLRIIVS